MDKSITVEVLKPPEFSRTGRLIPRTEAWKLGLWYGAFNLWILRRSPEPSILYQQRSPSIGWAPSKLDVALAGHYENGESVEDALNHEGPEELNVRYKLQDLKAIGRRLNVGLGTDGTVRNTINDLFLIEDNRPFDEFQPGEDEVYAICECHIDDLLKVHTDSNYNFEVTAKKFDGTNSRLRIDKGIFPYNWDNYHFKIALLAQRYFAGDSALIY